MDHGSRSRQDVMGHRVSLKGYHNFLSGNIRLGDFFPILNSAMSFVTKKFCCLTVFAFLSFFTVPVLEA
jgi:hypothetical protein